MAKTDRITAGDLMADFMSNVTPEEFNAMFEKDPNNPILLTMRDLLDSTVPTDVATAVEK